MGIWMTPEQQKQAQKQVADRIVAAQMEVNDEVAELRATAHGLRLQLGAQATHVTALQAAGTQQIENLRVMRAKWERAERLAEMHFEAWNKADMRARELTNDVRILKEALAARDAELRGLVSDVASMNLEMERLRPVPPVGVMWEP